MSSTAGAIYRPAGVARKDGAVGQLLVAISLVLLGLVVGLAIILLVRRLSGALVSSLTGGGVLLVALAVESTIATYRWFSFCTGYSVLSTQYFPRWPRSLPPRVVSYLILPGLAALAIVGSLTIRGTPAWGLILAWALVVSAESIQWLLHLRPDLLDTSWFSARRRLTAPVAESEELEVPRGLVQQLTRTLEGDRESIHALAKVEIAANDRFAAVHVAFCPPLAAQPQLSAHAIDADDADVRITQAETFGLRLEVRLPSIKAERRSVMIEMLGSVISPKAV